MKVNADRILNIVMFLFSLKGPVTVYLCATMWHETYNEMMKIIISMFR